MRSLKIGNPYQRRVILVIKSRKMKWATLLALLGGRGGEDVKKSIQEFDAENKEETHSEDLDVDGSIISIHNSNK